MKFMNNNYGYADFAKNSMGQNIPDNYSPRKERVRKGTAAQRDMKAAAIRAERSGRRTLGVKSTGKESGSVVNNVYDRLNGTKTKSKGLLGKVGKFVKGNKVAVGLAGAGALGAVGYGVYRKMRSDKGKKRGNYN